MDTVPNDEDLEFEEDQDNISEDPQFEEDQQNNVEEEQEIDVDTADFIKMVEHSTSYVQRQLSEKVDPHRNFRHLAIVRADRFEMEGVAFVCKKVERSLHYELYSCKMLDDGNIRMCLISTPRFSNVGDEFFIPGTLLLTALTTRAKAVFNGNSGAKLDDYIFFENGEEERSRDTGGLDRVLWGTEKTPVASDTHKLIKDDDGNAFVLLSLKNAADTLSQSRAFRRMMDRRRLGALTTKEGTSYEPVVVLRFLTMRGDQSLLKQSKTASDTDTEGDIWKTTSLYYAIKNAPVLTDLECFKCLLSATFVQPNDFDLRLFRPVGSLDTLAQDLHNIELVLCFVFGEAFKDVTTSTRERLTTGDMAIQASYAPLYVRWELEYAFKLSFFEMTLRRNEDSDKFGSFIEQKNVVKVFKKHLDDIDLSTERQSQYTSITSSKPSSSIPPQFVKAPQNKQSLGPKSQPVTTARAPSFCVQSVLHKFSTKPKPDCTKPNCTFTHYDGSHTNSEVKDWWKKASKNLS